MESEYFWHVCKVFLEGMRETNDNKICLTILSAFTDSQSRVCRIRDPALHHASRPVFLIIPILRQHCNWNPAFSWKV